MMEILPILLAVAVFLAALCIVCFVAACVLPGGIVSNFRKAIRVLCVALPLVAVILCVIVAFISTRSPQQAPQHGSQFGPNKPPPGVVGGPTQRTAQREPGAARMAAQQKAERQEAEKRAEAARMAAAEQARMAAEERDEKERQREELQDEKKWRNWTIDGKQIEAKFQKAAMRTVYLEGRDGAIIKVPLGDLSREEQYWISHRGWEK